MSVKSWLLLVCLLFLIGIGVLLGVGGKITNLLFTEVTIPEVENILHEKFEYGLKNAVDIQAQTLGDRLKLVPDKKEQQLLVEQFTDFQRFFDGEGYFFTYTSSGIRVNVPINKSLNGQDCTNLKDSNGERFVQKIISTGMNGGGFLNYTFEKPGAGIQPKLAYSCKIPNTDIVIGSGVYIDSIQTELQHILKVVQDKNHTYRWYNVITTIILGVILIAVILFIVRVICRPLLQLEYAFQEVTKGNMNVDVKLGRLCPAEIRKLWSSLDIMIAALKAQKEEAAEKTQEALSAVKEAKVAQGQAEVAQKEAEQARHEGMLAAANRIEAVMNTVSGVIDNLSSELTQANHLASDSSARLSEAATAMNEMNATVQEVAKNASSASNDSLDTKKKAQDGAEEVKQAVTSIDQAYKLSLALKDDMAKLSEQSKNISQIMNVISDIADQTNLLALNAAIEAARAGEAGRGFAVVADEVRKLAEKTMASTTDVGNVINAIQESSNASMGALENALKQIEQATNQANLSGKMLDAIVSTVDITASEISSIATASVEQSAASEEINHSIAQVDDMSRNTAKSMEDALQGVDTLLEQAKNLTQLIQKLKTA